MIRNPIDANPKAAVMVIPRMADELGTFIIHDLIAGNWSHIAVPIPICPNITKTPAKRNIPDSRLVILKALKAAAGRKKAWRANTVAPSAV